jgi:hypothetical protein
MRIKEQQEPETMAKLRPWYQVITPREDLRENRPLDASEFAVHLDHIRDNRAHPDYVKPERFFERTFMTKSLLDLSAQVVRRLSGIKVETSAVFNMATQFGGGKTHSLTALYHLARGGNDARSWRGVDSILRQAQVTTVPKANVAVFVGTEFDVIDGRGAPGEPRRKTPWGEIAWQLGGQSSFTTVEKHDEQGIAPAGDVIRKMLPKEPSVILIDELLNYVSRARKTGLSTQTYDFLQNLSEEARAQDHMVLCVSIPASELEMNPEDQRDYDSYKKLLDRVGKAVSMSSDTEVTEIIRRRLFDWGGLSDDMKRSVSTYAEWARDHASEVTNLGGDSAIDLFLSSYPFHPSVISVFERKWQSLPRFQRTRGILRLLALWVSWAYREEHQKAASEPLITLGSAPFDDQTFRDAVFEQLGTDQLSVPVMTDIAGKKDSHAKKLDKEAAEAIRKGRLHQKVATAIFMESNGGQSQAKAEASVSEIRAAVGGPDMNLADVETVLEGLSSTCFYLNWDRNRYRFGLRPNLNQILVTRRGAVTPKDIEGRIRKTTEDLFREGPKFLDRRFFPDRSNDVPDRPQLTLVVLGLNRPASETATKTFIDGIVRECGTSGRSFKSGLLFAVPDSGTAVANAARDVLAWEDINDDSDTVGQLEDSQKRSLNESLKRAKADLKESLWRAYRHIFLLSKTNAVKDNDLGQINSSMAATLPDLIVNTLRKDDEITDTVGSARLVRFWPPALVEWSTKAVRDAFFASPALPRLIDPESIKQTIADAVCSKLIGYARREGDRTILERFSKALSEHEVEISEDVVILKAEDAQKLLDPPRLDRLVISPDRVDLGPNGHASFTLKGFDQYGQPITFDHATWSAPGCTVEPDGQVCVGDKHGIYTVTSRVGNTEAQAQIRVARKTDQDDDDDAEKKVKVIRWQGSMPPQKWTNFYMKVISPFASTAGLILRVEVEMPPEKNEQQAKAQLEKIRNALRDLGLDDSVTLS